MEQAYYLCYSLALRNRVVYCVFLLSGRSAAWLARLVRDQEVEGSNPFAPTIFFNDLHNLGLLKIGSIWVQHRLKQSHF